MANGNTIVGFVAGSIPSSAPTLVAGVASSGSASADNLSNGSIAAIVVMSMVGLVGLMALIYYSMTRKSSSEENVDQEESAKSIGNFV